MILNDTSVYNQKQNSGGCQASPLGDLNLKHRRWDSHWSCLSLDQPDLLRGLDASSLAEETLQELRLVAFHWQDL